MKRASIIFLICFGVIEAMHSQTNEFVLEKLSSTSNTIQSVCKENGHRLASIEFFTAIQNVEFETVANNRIVSKKYDEKRGSYILCLSGVDKDWRYIQIDISKNGFVTYPMEAIQIKNGEYMAYKLSPKYVDTPKNEYIAQITIYGKDGKPLEGVKMTDIRTGKSELTNSEGVGRIKLEREGQAINIRISHPSYSDIINTTVRTGDNQKHTLLKYNPVKPNELFKPKHPWKCKPEKITMEASVIGGTNLGLAMNMTASYFLMGFGADWMIVSTEQTIITSLVNSGYTGNFTKTTTTDLSGKRRNLFLDLGVYFKFFSVSCQVGMLKTTVNRSSLYNGWGYGLVDEDLNEYWGSYEQRSFTNSTSDEETHLTITPQVKGYIPVGSKKNNSVSIGLGYTIIPSLNYNPGLSGRLGVHFRF